MTDDSIVAKSESTPEIKLKGEKVSTESLFGLFSVFFVSTLFLLLTIILMSLSTTQPKISLYWQVTFPIFLAGYWIVLLNIIIFYVVKVFKISRIFYQKYERTIKILVFLLVIIASSIVASLLSLNEDTYLKIIGIAGFSIIAVILVIFQEVFVELGKPHVSKLLIWLKIRKG
jgi:magnesium-transporting ATPase (P-type)